MGLLILLAATFITRLIYIFIPSIIWWDAAIYIGMGKHIYSGMVLGLWEGFRPIGWPLILGFFWKIGIDPSFIGKIFEVVAATAAVYFVFKIAEKLKPGAGIISATIFSFSPVFFAFTNVPITDIPTAFLIILAVYLAIEQKYVWAGFFASLAFTLRFPQALIMIALGLGIVIVNRSDWRTTVRNGLKLVAGFCILFVPYLIGNYIAYHDPLLPIKLGNLVFEATPSKMPSIFYYPVGLFIENPFIIFFIGYIALFIKNWKEYSRSQAHVFILLTVIIYITYFTRLDHKELRYGIAFLPFIAIGSGYAISVLMGYFQKIKTSYVVTAITVVLVSIGAYATHEYWPMYQLPPDLKNYYAFFIDKGNVPVMSTTPQIVAQSDIALVEIFDTWENAEKSVARGIGNVEYIGVNTCELRCMTDACPAAKQNAEKMLSALTPVFSGATGSCQLTIYKAR